MSTTIKTIERRPRVVNAGPAPLLLLLHGYGASEHDLFDLADYLDPRLHVVSARAPLALPWGGFAWYHLSGVPGKLLPDPVSRAHALDLFERFLTDLPGRLGTDPQRTLLLGFSQGAILSLALALRRPDLMAGVIALSGYFDLALLPDPRPALGGLPILQIHGTADEVIPIEAAQQTSAFLQTTDANHQYYEHPIGHGIHPQGLDLIQAWLTERLR